MTTAEVIRGESLSIGLLFKNNYKLPSTCNMIVYIGGVVVGNLIDGNPGID